MTRAISMFLCLCAGCAGSPQGGSAASGEAPGASAGGEVIDAPERDDAEERADAPEPEVVDEVAVPPAIAEVVGASDRKDGDRMLDEGRKPAELLAFMGVEPGMSVAEIGAGAGYTTELLARAVAPSGTAYGVNSEWLLEKFAQGPWTERLATESMDNAKRLDREFSDPFPSDLQDLDLVASVLVYHDYVWMQVDRDAMNRAVFRALKPGGSYVIVDHSGRAGTGSKEVKTLHRIDEAFVRAEVERAGFVLVEKATFLSNPSDQRDWNAAPFAAGERRGESDRFVLKFKKP